MKRRTFTLLLLLGLAAVRDPVQAQAKTFPLSLRTRDPQTNRIITKTKYVDASKIGIVIVDPWNYHWCMTWTEQARGMAPRMNRLNECRAQTGHAGILGAYRRSP